MTKPAIYDTASVVTYSSFFIESTWSWPHPYSTFLLVKGIRAVHGCLLYPDMR
jgi:hypothetical protein